MTEQRNAPRYPARLSMELTLMLKKAVVCLCPYRGGGVWWRGFLLSNGANTHTDADTYANSNTAGTRAGPCDGLADGERQQPGHGHDVHTLGDGAQRWRRSFGGYNAALLPVDGCDDHAGRLGGRVRPRWRGLPPGRRAASRST